MRRNKIRFLVVYILTILISACSPGWEITLISEDRPAQMISHQDVTFYTNKSDGKRTSITLGQILYASGFALIDTISFSEADGSTHTFEWDAIAGTATISTAGTVSLSDTEYNPKSISVSPSSNGATIEYSIMDIGPTVANALGLSRFDDAIGVNRWDESAEFGVMILLDGVKFQKFINLIDAGKLTFFDQNQNAIEQGLTVYPPITTSASAALLTSTPPRVNGVFGYGQRNTEATTLFDLAADAGLSVIAVEGPSLAFNLRNAETILSGDRDGDGFSDDNVLQNSLEVIRSGMPDLMYIHFHDIDNIGHTFGPDSPEYEAALIRVDGYLLEIYEALPGNTLLAIFADHGMHATKEGGNHGLLTAEDMIIPILFIKK